MKILLRIISTALLVLLLAACAFYPKSDVSMPDELPDQFIGQQGAEADQVLSGSWWQQFGDEHLNQLMDEMFSQNLQLEQAHARLQQARSAFKSVRSARFPSIGAEGQGGRSMQPTLGGDFTGDSYQFSGVAAYELDLWGKIASRAESAGKSYEATYEELQTLYLGLTAQLAELYYLAVEQRAQLILTDESIRSFADTVESVEERYRLGVVSAVDVYQARQNLTAARANRHLFAANLATAEHGIAVLIGRYPDRDSAGDLATLPTAPEAFPTGIPSELIGRRPDLRASLRLVEAADADVAAAIADRFPSINLLGSYGTSSQDFATGLVEGDFWSYLGSLTLPIFDAGRRRSEVERNKAVARERVAAYQQAALTAFKEVEDALVNNRETELRIASLVDTEAATGATLRLSLDRYFYGVTDYLPVLSAQRLHFDTRSRLLTARRQLISARISLARALGGEWMQYEIEKRQTAKQDDKS